MPTRCPVCDAPTHSTGPLRSAEFPFCSPRCRDIDLKRWLCEEYFVPVETPRVIRDALLDEVDRDDGDEESPPDQEAN
jgi:endogenous inhibitor of DNA gyrase (YacG/DUF329 family)